MSTFLEKSATFWKVRRDFLCPEAISVNYLRRMTEIVQTAETCMVPTLAIANLAFVFAMKSL